MSTWYGLPLFRGDRFCRLESDASEESNRRLLYLIIYQGISTRKLFIDFFGQPRIDLTGWRILDVKERRVFYSEKHGHASAPELLLPSEDVHNLGLPVLALPQNGITTLQSAVDQLTPFPVEPFIEYLGMRRFPTLDKIIAQAALGKPEERHSALRYLLSNLETHYKAYKSDDFAKVAFIPTECGSLACPNEVTRRVSLGCAKLLTYLYRYLHRPCGRS